MERLNNIHPGEILQEKFLTPLEISAYRLAKETFIPQTRISEIIKGNRKVTRILHYGLRSFLAQALSFGWVYRVTTTWRKFKVKKKTSWKKSTRWKILPLKL